MSGFVAWRDRMPRWMKIAAAIVVPLVLLESVQILGIDNPWVTVVFAACGLLLSVLVVRVALRTIPLVKLALFSAAAYGVFAIVLFPLSTPASANFAVLALGFLLAAYVLSETRQSRRLLWQKTIHRHSAPRALPQGRAESWARFFVLLVAASLIVALGRLCWALLPPYSFLTTASVELHFFSHTFTFGWESAKLPILADTIAGGALTFGAARARGAQGMFAAIAALFWVVAAGRLGPTLAHFTPTFVVPLFALVLWRPVNRGNEGRWMLVGGTALLAGLLYAPLLLPCAILLIAWYVERRSAAGSTESRDATVALAFLACAAAAVLFAIFFGSLVRLPATIISSALDARIRLIGGDGTWPWQALYPALTSDAFGTAAQLLYRSTAYVGNALWENNSLGWSLAATSIVGLICFRKEDRAKTASFFTAAGISLLCALPSHTFGVPLPTPAELSYVLGNSGWIAPAASLSLVLATAIFASSTLTRLVENGRLRTTAILLVILFLDSVLASTLFPRLPDNALAAGIRSLSAQPSPARTLVSLYRDDPRQQLGQAVIEYSIGANPTEAASLLKALPAKNRLTRADLGMPSAPAAVVDFAAYSDYRDAPFTRYIFIPEGLLGSITTPEQISTPEIDGTIIKGIYGSVVVYYAQR